MGFPPGSSEGSRLAEDELNGREEGLAVATSGGSLASRWIVLDDDDDDPEASHASRGNEREAARAVLGNSSDILNGQEGKKEAAFVRLSGGSEVEGPVKSSH